MHLLRFHLEAKTLTEIPLGEFAAEPGCRYFYVQGKHAAVPVLTRDGIGEIVWQHPDYEPPSPANDMTDQHYHCATPAQWTQVSKWVDTDEDSSCIVELRDRIQLLETYIAAIEPLSTRIQAATGSALHLALVTSKLGHRVEALEATQHTHIGTLPARDEQREATAAEAGARFAVEQLRSKPGSWQPLPEYRVREMQHRIRDGSLTLAEALEEMDNAPAPAADAKYLTLAMQVGCLVATFASKGLPGDDAVPTAREIFRLIAEHLRSDHPNHYGPGTAWADYFDSEADD